MTFRSNWVDVSIKTAGFTLVGAAALLLAACAANPQLVPAPPANQLNDQTVGAVAQTEGVRIVAAVQAWDAVPRHIQEVQPVLVTIHNHSGRTLLVQYAKFQLVSADGRRYRALAPLSLDEKATVTVQDFEPYYGEFYSGFAVAPYWDTYYDVFGLYDSFIYDPYYYDTYDLRQIELPTGAMLERAMPEGALAPGGMAKGFLYFEELHTGMQGVHLRVELVNARSGDQFGTLTIPFDVVD